MDIKKHKCLRHFIENGLDRSDTQVIVTGHCELCCYRMTKIYRYMGTYDRGSLKKLDPLPAKTKQEAVKDKR